MVRGPSGRDLRPRERRVVELRFGLEGDKLYTLSEIGQELGVTRERLGMEP